MFQGFYPPEPRPRLQHEPAEELTALRNPHLHFTTFENSIFVKKWTLVKLLARSNVNEVIRVVFFFLQKDFTRTKSTKRTKNTNKRISDFFSLRCFLSAFKTLPFLFLFTYMRFVFFVRVKSFRKNKNKNKTDLMTSFTLFLKSTSKKVLSVKSLSLCPVYSV